MPRADRPGPEEETSRRSVVPEAAGRSLWLAAVWTGVGATIVCAITAIVAVAAVWLPASSGSTGRTSSAIHAGLLTFLASVHGGVTVNGVAAQWLPLGMMITVGVMAWRAGSGLADAANDLGETDPARLAIAGFAQAMSFTVATTIVVPFAGLGSSDAPILGVGASALLLFLCSGAVAFARSSALRDQVLARLPEKIGLAARAAASALTIYVGVGAVLVAGSLALHHHATETISRQVGGGAGGIPILLLGILAAPNAIVYALSYLSGPGFALGVGNHVNLTGAAHGTLPAFPLLGAIPSGHGANPIVWALAVAMVIGGGLACARVARAAGSFVAAVRTAATAAGISAFAMVVLGWQAGGSIGSARLQTVGPSPWQLGLAVGLEIGVVSLATLGALAVFGVFGGGTRELIALPGERANTAPAAKLVGVTPEEPAEDDQLAG